MSLTSLGYGAALNSNAVGFIGAAVAIVGFGCALVPAKHVQTGDGIFFQWIMCASAWFVGLVIQLFRDSPTFYPLSMLGGFLWTTGNIMMVPILKTIGLGPGMLIWASVNMITGWMSGHFGWFGLHPDEVTNQTLNYIGFVLSLLRLVVFVGVKPDYSSLQHKQDHLPDTVNADADRRRLLTDDQLSVNVTSAGQNEPSADASWVDQLSLLQKRIFGSVMSLLSGFFYGVNFIPCIWTQENLADQGASQDGLDYVFAHFCGIFATSSAYFLIYCAYMQNKPQFPHKIVIPGLASGAMWGVAQAGWFIANSNLTESVAFPIVTTGPSLLTALWSVLYFREIRGRRNYLFLIVAFTVAIAGVTLTALSKV